MLENAKTLRGFEAIQKAFTGVNYFEKDKTEITAFLFVFFGSLCLLDAGYGLLLLILGYVLAIKKNRDFGQVFMWTGGVSMVLGLLCGQVFGLSFAKDIVRSIPPLLTLATEPMVCFKFSILAGMFAILLSNGVAMWEKGLFTHHTGNFFLMVGGFCYVIREKGLLIGKFFDPSLILFWVSWSFFSLCFMVWLFVPEPTFGEDKRYSNILWMLYAGPLQLVQDILSHMRLFGIALSGSILALVVNKVATLLPVLLGIAFVPVGHAAVFLLSLLSLYIHSSRLIFLEFGSKCMSGGHHYFQPFSRR